MHGQFAHQTANIKSQRARNAICPMQGCTINGEIRDRARLLKRVRIGIKIAADQLDSSNDVGAKIKIPTAEFNRAGAGDNAAGVGPVSIEKRQRAG